MDTKEREKLITTLQRNLRRDCGQKRVYGDEVE
jgi:hypothetical protein